MRFELEDENARAAGPLLLFFGSGFLATVTGAIVGDPVSGFVVAPIVGWLAIESVYAAGPAFVESILPYFRTRSAQRAEEQAIRTNIRERQERAAEVAHERREIDAESNEDRVIYFNLENMGV